MDVSQLSAGLGQLAALAAGEDIFNAFRFQSLHEKDDLVGATVEIAPALYVKNFHR